MNDFSLLEGKGTASGVGDSRGFSLPTVLFLVTILSLLAASILAVQLLRRQAVLADVARARAANAAASGIAEVIGEITVLDEALPAETPPKTHVFTYSDGSEARVVIEPWGMQLLVSSEGSYHKWRSQRVALCADIPTEPFDRAVWYGSSSHQLIFAGTTRVAGDVTVGRAGAAVGSLPDCPTPLRIPVQGKVESSPDAALPNALLVPLQQSLRIYHDRISQIQGGNGRSGASVDAESFIRGDPGFHFPTGERSDSIRDISVTGDITIDEYYERVGVPLSITALGRVKIARHASIRGLISIVSSSPIVVDSGARLSHVVLLSEKAISVAPGARVSGQCIAPVIEIGRGAHLTYPSYVLSESGSAHETKQRIDLSEGVVVEGFVGLVSSNTMESEFPHRVIRVNAGAKVVGALYSEQSITLDGIVEGSVVTRDFFFSIAPTSYFGWLRSATIDRTKLPQGALLPPGLSRNVRLDILAWM